MQTLRKIQYDLITVEQYFASWLSFSVKAIKVSKIKKQHSIPKCTGVTI